MYKCIIALVIGLLIYFPVFAQDPSFVSVKVSDPNNAAWACGVIFHHDPNHSFVMLASHILKEDDKIAKIHVFKVVDMTGEVVYNEPDADLAILRTQRIWCNPRPISKRAPRIGQRICFEGRPYGKYKASWAKIIELENTVFLNDKYLSIDFVPSCQPGDSGGPVMNEQGELLGIISSKYSDDQTHYEVGSAVNVYRLKSKIMDIVGEKSILSNQNKNEIKNN